MFKKKKDVVKDGLIPWDEYRGKAPEDAMASIYKHACEASQQARDWYWKSIGRKRVSSYLLRWVACTLLCAGTILPLLAALWTEPADKLWFTQIGLALLALAGLLQLADRVFGSSSGWLRYVTTATAMENATRKFELSWHCYMLTLPIRPAPEHVQALYGQGRQLEEEIMRLQGEETEKWVSEFNTGMALLDSAIKAQRESNEQAVKAGRAVVDAKEEAARAQEKANQPGAIEAKIIHPAAPQKIKIQLDGETPEEFHGTVWVHTGVPPGLHVVRITEVAGVAHSVATTAEVTAGKAVKVDLSV